MPARGVLALLVLTACGGDTTITRRNDPPVATIDAPADGAEVREGATVTLRGTVLDTDDTTGDLLAAWFSGADTLCAAVPIAEDGTTSCEAELDVGDEEIVLEGRDPDNAVGIASLGLVILTTGAPDVDILAPDGAGPYYADHDIAFAAIVGDAEDDETALTVAWADAAGGALDIDATPEADGTLAGVYGFDTGPHAVTLTVTDTTGKTASTTIALQVGEANVPPGCTITAPVDGLQVGQGVDVAFTGTVVDVDVAEDLLGATWSSDLDGTLTTGNADVDGNVAFDTATLTGGLHTITLTGTDEVGATCVDSIVVDVSAPPTVDIDLPVDGDLYNDGVTTTFAATVADDSTAADALLLAWESDLDGVLDTTPADGSGVAGFDAAWLSVGTHTVTLTVTDEAGLSTTASAWFVVNGLPTAPTVEIDPSAPAGTDDLVATVVSAAVDPEGDPIAYAYAWYVDGVATAYTSDTLSAAATSRGEVWEVYVTPNDGYGDGTAGTASVTIGNSAPTLVDVTLTPDPAYEGDTLTCAPGAASDADGDAIAYTYAWTVDGVALADTSTTLDASAFEHGDVVVCTVTPTDGTDAGAPVASNALTITNAVPSLASVEIDPSAPEAGDTLTCTATGFADGDGDADQSVYEWTVDGVYAGSGTTLSGAFLGGDEVICAVTPYDGIDYGAVLSESVTIDNAAPALADVTLTPASPSEADLLVCTPGVTTDIDGTTSFTYTYAWTVDGASLAATASTLDSSAFAKGDVIACFVTPNDGTDDGVTVASNTVTAVNTPPEVAAATLSPTDPDTDATLTATVATSDLDGDSVTVSYAWYVNGGLVGSGVTLDGSAFESSFQSGDSVYVVVTPNDGEEDGAPYTSAAVVVANTLPVLTGVTLTPGAAYEATTLTCTPTATDADGDAITYTYAWTVDAAAVAATGATLTGTDFDRGGDVVCAATPNDGSGSGTPGTSNTVTISNTAPVMTSVALTPATASESSTLTCTPGATDADGDAVTYSYAWFVNSAALTATSSTLTGTDFDGGDSIYCRATPTDGTTVGTAMVSNTVSIGNTAPVLSAVTLTPTTATVASTLTCTPTASDADGDAISYTYAWYVNASAVAATSSTLTATYFDATDTVYCRVTPTDGTTAGTAISSNTVTIDNTAPVISGVVLSSTTAYEASTLTCTPTATDADGDAITYTYAWYVNASAVAATSTTLTGTYFDRDDTVYCRVTPNDGTTSGTASNSNTVTISNTAPVMASVALTPTSADESSTLTCTPAASDADSDAVTYTYAWYVNGTANARTSSTLTGTYFDGGDSVYCRVTPTDGTTAGTAMASNTVTIANTAPVLSAVALTPTTATAASTLTCTPTASDADGDAISYTYAWYVNASAVAATSSTLTATYFDAGDTVYCRVTPTDGTTAGTAMSSNVVTISNTAPVLSGVTLTPTTAYEASTLTCTPTATDADGDAITYTYAWYVSAALIAPTTSTLTGSYFSKASTVYCRVTPNDGTTSGTAASSNTVTISNTAPVISAVSLTPTTAYEASTLTCTPTATDADSDAITYTYAWYVNGSAVAATSSTLTGTYFSSGNTVYCGIRPTDGTTAGTVVLSNTVTISNTAPVISVVSLTPTSAYEASTLTCTPTATDADGAAVTYTYAWYVNGVANARTTSTLTGTYFGKADTVYCRVTPSDGTTSGSAASSNTVTIDNTAPGAPVLAIDPTAPVEGVDDLLCDVVTDSTDADGDVVDYDISWTVDGVAYPGAFAATGPDTTTWLDDTIPAADTAFGTTWVCTAVPFDAEDDGTSATATVDVDPGTCSGNPAGPVCSGATVNVAYLPGWANTHTGSTSLIWSSLETNSLAYGGCTIDITSVGSGFTLATLSAYDAIVISDPSGGSRLYTAAELTAIRDYLEGGYGGAVGTYLLEYLAYANSSLYDLFGIDSTGITSGSSSVSTGGTVVDATHPVADNLPASFTLLGYGYEQSNSGGWTDADLLGCAELVIDSAGGSSVIANDDYNWRSVYFTGMPEYSSAGTDSRQAIYNSILWAAGYQ
ncbi:MAG: hypothetical protein Q8P41_00185 [Pseudomonadota bacterium]|nr:hypothetical protein [Pseudomonadota bacterium]